MKKFLKVAVSVLIMVVLAAFLTACGNNDPAPDTGDNLGPVGETFRVGVSMPTMDLQRWNQDGYNLQALLTERGFDVDLQFAANDVPTQVAQLENMIAMGAEILVIAAVDGDSLTEVLAMAYDQGIRVIAYDRLIMNTHAVSYYATFDNFLVGQMQGAFIRDTLDLENQEGPFYIEFFTGDPGDNNIFFFFPGAMSVLQPFLDSGVLVSPSGQTDIMQAATMGWSTENAQTRMENLIALNNLTPGGHPLHAVMCSNDSTAQGVTNALRNAGWAADNFPIVTGQDCDIISVRNMIAGYQAMSVFKDTRVLASNVVDMVVALFEGNPVPINNTTDYNNGVFYVPTYLSDPIVATIENYRELLIDGGYYTEAELYG